MTIVRPLSVVAAKTRACRFAHARPPARQSGFSLIELIVAFALLAVALGVALGASSGGLRQARQSVDFTEAALNAQSLLDTIGFEERLEEGSYHGDFDKHYSWQLEVSRFEPAIDGLIDPQAVPVELYRLDLEVSWDVGERQQTTRFSTIRALFPQPAGLTG